MNKVTKLKESINEEMYKIVNTIESCTTGEQLLQTHNLIDNFKSSYEYLKKKKTYKPLYENVQNFINYQKVKINLKMYNQLIENDKL